MKQVGTVEVPQEAFLAVLNLDGTRSGDAGRCATTCERCDAALRAGRRGDDLLLRVHVLSSTAQSDARARPPELRVSELVPRPRRRVRSPMSGVRHLYVHLPFCAHRCGYCDFVTVVGRTGSARGLRRCAARRARRSSSGVLAEPLETVYPRRRHADVHRRRPRSSACSPRCRAAEEITVEANPETVTPALAAAAARAGVNRVSLGAQSFQPRLLDVLERRARARRRPARGARVCVMPVSTTSRSTSSTASPARAPADLDADLDGGARARARAPLLLRARGQAGDALHARVGEELARQAEAMEGYFERVVETLDRRRLPLVRDGELLPRRRAGGTSGRATTSATGSAATTSGSAIGAVSTVGRRTRRRTRPGSRATSPRSRGERPPREVELLDDGARAASGSCSACGSTSRCRSPGSRTRSTLGRARRLERLGLAEQRAAAGSLTLTRARPLPRRRRDRRAPGASTTLAYGCGRMARRADSPSASSEILRRVVEEYVATGQPVGSKSLVERVGTARLARRPCAHELAELEAHRAAHASAHVGRPRADRRGYRYYADGCSSGSSRAGVVPARPVTSAQRGRVGAAGDDRDACAGDAAARARLRAAARGGDRPSTSRCSCSSRRLVMVVVITSAGGVTKRALPLRRAGRSGPRDWARRVPERAARRSSSSGTSCFAGGSRTPASSTVERAVPRAAAAALSRSSSRSTNSVCSSAARPACSTRCATTS